ncbi:hypothetical protein AB0B56_42595 [Streptosporangium canum]|uniref:hypothetical protein n=1 Tax=Streptosporangium canum TaxID=324952 RepID=UPI0034279F92
MPRPEDAPERLQRIPGGHRYRHTVRFTGEENRRLEAAVGSLAPRSGRGER